MLGPISYTVNQITAYTRDFRLLSEMLSVIHHHYIYMLYPVSHVFQ